MRLALTIFLALPALACADGPQRWPRFRGPGGRGVTGAITLPATFDGKTGRGVLWKTAVPLPGKNSPVIWDGRVFLSGATKERCAVYCFDAATGKLRWTAAVRVPARPARSNDPMKETGWAPSTLATDGSRVCAIFPTGVAAAFDLDGKPLWTRELGWPDNPYGHAASLLLWRDRLLVQLDQGKPADKRSALVALDAATGRTLYSAARPVGASWTSPILVPVAGGEQLVTCSNPWVIAHDPATGRELWRVKCLAGDGGPSPTFAGGLVLAMNVDSDLVAIRPGGKGDVTKTHVAWRAEDGISDIPSPVAGNGLVFLADTAGMVTCYDLKSGRKLWEKDFEESVSASPALVGDRLLLVHRTGQVRIMPAARQPGAVQTSALGERCEASPAFAGGRLYLRGEQHLFCIGTR